MKDREAVASSEEERLSVATDSASEELERVTIRELEEPEGFEGFLAELATNLTDLSPESADLEIPELMSRVARRLGVDRCGLALFTSDRRSLLLTAQGFAQAWVPQWRILDLAALLPWYTEEVRRGRTHVWSNIPDDLPPAAAREIEYIRAIGLCSHVMVPLRVGAEVLGCFGVGRFGTTPPWNTEMVGCFERLAAVFADSMRQRSGADRVRASEDLTRSLLASAPAAMLVLDRSGRVTHASAAWMGLSRCQDCPDVVSPGTDYLDAIGRAPAERRASTWDFRDGVQSVLEGKRARFEAAYHCSRSVRACHFQMVVTPLAAGGALIVQTDVAEIEQAKADLERSRLEVREVRDRLEAETACLRKEVFRVQGFDEVVGTSAALSKVLHGIEQVAAADSPILILGETGTGKDLAARAIHERSRRRNRPLVPVNCAALPDALIESELFGFERGAFTGAVARTLGRFEAANGGSILLDEIGEMPLAAQAKLLRVIESGTFERLGSSKSVQVDVRVLAATNRDLEREVREGRFRADLFYRLNVFPVTLPPLRERIEDIPLLVWHFINAKQGVLGKSIKRVPDQLMRSFEAYAWPGNIRELENVIERALIVTTGSTLEIDAPFLERAHEESTVGSSLDDVQRAHIQEVLRKCGWKVAGRGDAAERLGLKRGTLQFRMKKLGIQRPESGA